MSEMHDHISRDADKNIKHENIPKIKNNSQLQMYIEYPPHLQKSALQSLRC